MKKFMQRKSMEMGMALENAKEALKGKFEELRNVAKDERGISETVEKLLWTLAGAVVVGIVVVLAIALINDDIFPGLSSKVKELLNL